MGRAMRGDGEAVSELVTRHHGGLLAYLYRLCGGDRALAEDLAQESFIHLIRGRSYREGSPFKPWLFAIATNLARDHHRRLARRPVVAPDVDVARLRSDRGDPAAEIAATDERNRVARAIGSLDVEFRAVLLMRFFHDMSMAAIAAALDIPLGTVKSRLHVGVRRLRDLLATEVQSR